MKVVFDINIWVDIAARPTSFQDSVSLFRLLQKGVHTTCFPLHGYTTVDYLLSRYLGKKASLEFLKGIKRKSVQFLSFGDDEVRVAQGLMFGDHEDACLAATAFSHSCDLIVTRNLADFRRSPVEAISPKVALKKLI